jgi:hypothetical protein
MKDYEYQDKLDSIMDGTYEEEKDNSGMFAIAFVVFVVATACAFLALYAFGFFKLFGGA